MTVDPSYVISPHVVHTHDDDGVTAVSMCLRCMLELHIADGELVPDTRLQAIAGAWAKMSDRDRGRIRSWVPHFISTIEDALTEVDALTEENNDGEPHPLTTMSGSLTKPL